MSKEITQGSIISSIRSPKYSGIKCYGIIISARCDLAQGKIDCVHTISALPLSSWLQTVVFQKALSIEIKSQLKIIQKWAQTEGQDLDSLIELGPDKAILNVQANPQSTEYAKALCACKLWKQTSLDKGIQGKEAKKVLPTLHKTPPNGTIGGVFVCRGNP